MDAKDLACITLLVEEEEDEEELLLLQYYLQKRDGVHELFKKRKEEGYFNLLINSHLKEDERKFRDFFRLNKEQFNFVVSLTRKDLEKPGTNFVKHPITPEEKIALTLRYLATGESFRSLAFAFRISHSYISTIIKDALKAICKTLVPIFMPPPTTDSLKRKSNEFFEKWNYPNCVGAVDGKHVRIFCPAKSGSLYYNYKNYFSIVLLALVDANYKFIAVDVGSYGKEGDSSIFNKSILGKKIMYSENFFPQDQLLPNSDKCMPFVIVGDETFRLHKHIMKPFNKLSASTDGMKAIFNYRLSRARRVSENAFGLLSQIFRVFYTHIAVKPEICDNLIIAACCLHNLLREGYLEKNGRSQYEYEPNEVQSNTFTNLTRGGGFQNAEGFQIRNEFAEYFYQEGAVEWQEEHISRIE